MLHGFGRQAFGGINQSSFRMIAHRDAIVESQHNIQPRCIISVTVRFVSSAYVSLDYVRLASGSLAYVSSNYVSLASVSLA